MIYVSQFLNMAFPKAGVLLDTIPVTAATLVFGLALLFTLGQDRRAMRKIPGLISTVYLGFVLLLMLITVANFRQAEAKQLAMAIVLAISPLAILLGIKASNHLLALRIVALALMITGFYAIIQYLLGIEATTIPGVNLALGDSWSAKPIAMQMGEKLKYVKMPATYQNGNLAAAFYIVALPFMLSWQNAEKIDRHLRFAALALGFVGLILAGSRSALYPFLCIWASISLVYIFWQKLKGFSYLLVLFASIASILVLMAWLKPDLPPQHFIMDRYVTQTRQDPTANNRTVQWHQGIQQVQHQSMFSQLRMYTMGQDWDQLKPMEGFLAMGMAYGFIAAVLFIILMLGIMYKVGWESYPAAIVALGLLAGFLQFTIDSTFWQPPTLINWFFTAGLAVKRTSIDWPDKGIKTRNGGY